MHLVGFYYKNISRCTVLWMSNWDGCKEFLFAQLVSLHSITLLCVISEQKNNFNPLNAELNPICHLLALLGGATIVVVSRLRVKYFNNFNHQLWNWQTDTIQNVSCALHKCVGCPFLCPPTESDLNTVKSQFGDNFFWSHLKHNIVK